MMERPVTRRGVRRRPANDDDDIAGEMPPNKKALVDLLENLCISMNTNKSASTDQPDASKFMSSNGPRQYLFPRRNRYNVYSDYMRQMKDAPAPPPRDPSLGTIVLYNTPSVLPSPLRRYMLPPFTIPEGRECDGEFDDGMDVDMDVDYDGVVVQVQTQPRLAGNLTHGEWFLPNDDEEDDTMDMMDML